MYAAIDLGSNSFHMIVARDDHGELRVIDRIKEMVRLGGGLNDEGQLDEATREAALSCLSRFGQRIKGIPDSNVRAVGTQTFRRLRNPATFLVVAETALGSAIDIVSGREEARLVYIGVRRNMPADVERRLVIDIGGGSTEVVAGDNLEPVLAESIPFGCVATTRQAFPDGQLGIERWRQARAEVLGELQQFRATFRGYGWDQAVGSSGTIRAVQSMITQLHPDEPAGITRPLLRDLRDRFMAAGEIGRLDVPGLSERRRPVIAGGVLILDAVMKALRIERLQVSDFALREGLLYDLLGRLAADDPRDQTVSGMARRYDCDPAQAERVSSWACTAFDQVAAKWKLGDPHRALLRWACQLHEMGLAIAHDGAAQHGGYILQHADMPGFTRNEQALMALLVAMQRDRPDAERIQALPPRLHTVTRQLLALLRLAILFNRARSDSDAVEFDLSAKGSGKLLLALPDGWLDSHPLTSHDLAVETDQLVRLGISLKLGTPQRKAGLA